MAGKKLGRPKKDKDDKIFIGMKISESLAKELSKDASLHFRNRSQHIQWILKTYIIRRTLNSKTEYKMQSSNTSIYTDKEMDEMQQYYNKENKGDS